MRPSVMLRVASVISLLFAAGHMLGGLRSWSPPGDTEVLRAMRAFRFDAEGVSRTYWDFYVGFGHMISVFLLAQAVLLWQLGTLAKTAPIRVRPIVAVFVVAALATAVLAWKFFFAVPLMLALAIAACLGVAWFLLRDPTQRSIPSRD
jgi:hypothetical protein